MYELFDNPSHLLRRKSCAWFGLHFSIYLLCQVKILDEKTTRHDDERVRVTERQRETDIQREREERQQK